MNPPLLTVRNLRVEFPTRTRPLVALDGLSFEVARGEILGLVGESGAGKSLTGAAIAGLLDRGWVVSARSSSTGTASTDWMLRRSGGCEDAASPPSSRTRSTALNPLYTVGRQLVETLQTHFPLNHAEARQCAAALRRRRHFRAAGSTRRPSARVFRGRLRVAIALALAGEPSWWWPTTHHGTTRRCRAQIMDLPKRFEP